MFHRLRRTGATRQAEYSFFKCKTSDQNSSNSSLNNLACQEVTCEIQESTSEHIENDDVKFHPLGLN